MEFQKLLCKPIPGLDGYMANNLGDILRVKTGQGSGKSPHRLKPYLAPGGYLLVNITQNGKQKTYYIHELVALTFLGPRPALYWTHHLDEIKTNNQIENIRYVTISEHIKIHVPQRRKK